MKKVFILAFLLCFIAAFASAQDERDLLEDRTVFSEDQGDAPSELDLGEPTDEEKDQMDRESEWTEEEENDYPGFDGDVDGSTQQMQDF